MTTVAAFGTGYMGPPTARSLATAGHDVRVWNESVAFAEHLGVDPRQFLDAI